MFDGLDRKQVKAVIEFAARSLDKAPAYARQMRVIFDQATPVPIRPHLEGHTVHTAAQNMGYRQNPAGRRTAIVVLGLAAMAAASASHSTRH